MFDFLSGVVADINGTTAVIEVNGVGFEVNCTSGLVSELKIGNSVKLYTYLAVKEDDLSLYGFSSKAEKNIFLRLKTVNGIGAKAAIGILCGVSADELALCIVNGDVKRLNSIKGVGKKTAERIILELKDKLSDEYKDVEISVDIPKGGVKEEAILALMSLGFNKNEAAKAIESVEGGSSLSLEETVRLALKNRR